METSMLPPHLGYERLGKTRPMLLIGAALTVLLTSSECEPTRRILSYNKPGGNIGAVPHL